MVYVHIPVDYANKLQDVIGSFAFIGVTLFFMISAYGMQLNAERKKDYFIHFWRNRLAALLIPCVLVNICGFLLGAILRGNFLFSDLWNLNAYVRVLIEYCILFYIVKNVCCWLKWKEKTCDALLISGVVASSLVNYLNFHNDADNVNIAWPYERMGLVYGILLYRFYDKATQWLNEERAKKASVALLCSLAMGIAYLKLKTEFFYGEYLLKILLGATIILFLFLFSSGKHFGSKACLFLGSISYEVYLSHGLVMAALSHYAPSLPSGVFIVGTIVLTLLFASLLYVIGKPIVSVLRRS